MTMRSSLFSLLAFLFFVCAAIGNANAMRGTTGILEGRILDRKTKEPLIGVNVFVIGTPYGVASDAEGLYLINNIRAGVYDVRYSIVGYKTVVMKRVTILPDLRTRIDIELDVTTIEMDLVEVRAERPLIQKDLAATSFSIGEIKIEKLPISSFKEILTLQPGTTIEGNVRGGKTTEVAFLVDGLPVQDVIGGGLAANLPRSSITALTMNTGGFEAEYGNALSGVVNVITKSGGESHKIGGRYERDNWIPEKWDKQVDRFSELELFAGGPLRAGDLSYFTAHTITATDTRWWQDFRFFFLSPISQEFTGFGKIEYVPSSRFRLSGQVLYSLRQWHDYEFSWRFNLDGLPLRSRDAYRAAVILTHTLSESSFYTLSLSRFYHRSMIGENVHGVLLQPYEYDFFLRYIVGGNRNWGADTRQIIYSLKGEFTSHIQKMHFVKVGFEFNQYDIYSDVVKFEPRLTYFGKPILDAPMLSYSNSYKYYPRSGSVFVQDKLEIVRDGSNVSAGIRWDFLDPTAERPEVEFVPTKGDEYEQRVVEYVKARFKHQISPRLSFAAPAGPASFVFANFGMYFQFPLFDYLYSGINPAQLRQGARNVYTGNPDLEPERTIAWEVGLKHGIGENVVASATYFKKIFRNQIDAKTLIPYDSKYAGDYGFASYVNNSEANATGLEFVLSRERDERLSGSVSYSYMVTEGISEYVGQQVNFAQWGFPSVARPFSLSWDQRHTIKADGDFKLPYDIQANVVVLYNSPRPYTFYPTRDGFTPVDTSKVFIPNNARMKEVLFINAKVSKQFMLDLSQRYLVTVFADIRNLLNAKNVRWMDSSGRIGGELDDPGAYYDLRRVRVGLKVEF